MMTTAGQTLHHLRNTTGELAPLWEPGGTPTTAAVASGTARTSPAATKPFVLAHPNVLPKRNGFWVGRRRTIPEIRVR
jgi:hypothetical protein